MRRLKAILLAALTVMLDGCILGCVTSDLVTAATDFAALWALIQTMIPAV